ncbi:MAG: hypothetical protein RLZZ292_3995 [Bacteroidota bacterium]|jgi:hypothetical protein
MARVVKKSIELSEPLLIRAFGLTRTFDVSTHLKEVLQPRGALSDAEKNLLSQVRNDLIENTDSWNEEELKMQFISMIMFLARFQAPIRNYYDREISETISGIFVKCKADLLLAQGVGELIEVPYFFLHEYKREKRYSGDPVGQMLAGMLIAQAKNNNDKPMYGCYVQGRFWFFSVLIGKEYVISQSFDATDEIMAERIVLILHQLKHIILTQLR